VTLGILSKKLVSKSPVAEIGYDGSGNSRA
jgi:hypothetical protein